MQFPALSIPVFCACNFYRAVFSIFQPLDDSRYFRALLGHLGGKEEVNEMGRINVAASPIKRIKTPVQVSGQHPRFLDEIVQQRLVG